MSRNLCRMSCDFCDSPVTVDEPWREITQGEAGVYFDEYKGMAVAKSHCSWCGAKYLAWGSPLPQETFPGSFGLVDLSFQSTFNDEPGPSDLPNDGGALNKVEVLQGAKGDELKDAVLVYSRGEYVGTLMVKPGDGAKFQDRLMPWGDDDE